MCRYLSESFPAHIAGKFQFLNFVSLSDKYEYSYECLFRIAEISLMFLYFI